MNYKNWVLPHDFLFIAAGVLLTLILVGLILKIWKMSTEKRRREDLIRESTAGIDAIYQYFLDKKILKPNSMHEFPIKHKLENIRKKIEDLVAMYYSEESPPAPPVSDTKPTSNTKPISDAKPQESCIKAQVLLSAGPRKESGGHDTELGEDVAGTLSLSGQTFFWLLDGTSDSTAIHEEGSHIFSSRLLAQNISYHIQRNIHRYYLSSEPLTKLVEEASAAVLQEWTKRINQTTPEKKAAIIRLFDQGFRPLCSTTLLMGSFSVSGSLEALRIGDSKLFPFLRNSTANLEMASEFPFSKDPTTESDRIAFVLDYSKENDQFSIRSNMARNMTAALKDVTSVFVFSDGIGRVTEMQLASNNPGIVELMLQNIGHIPQKTYDDKSLIVLERVIN